ncbi:MAG: DUF411 domain-containing protein [Wenzhouxiangellaceae bacterium]|nr:DUF411 domain-containing protein [Wenzhouxiangellaceae bacterium]
MKTKISLLATLFIAASSFTTSVVAEPPAEGESQSPPEMVVHHDPACGCCGKWMAHMREAGFAIRSETGDDLRSVKQRFNIPGSLQSCHTAVVGGYAIEGHVPASDVQRLLAEQPDVAGIAVPGMPMGSPGMEYGNQRQAFDVVSFDEAGGTAVFNHYEARTE